MNLLQLVLACAPKSPQVVEAPPDQAVQAPALEAPMTSPLHPELAATLNGWSALDAPDTLSAERRETLGELAGWIAEKQAAGEPAHLLFVCTHNSRRSHMGQLWAQAAAEQLGVQGVESWSGGTEATAFNPRAVRALQTHGMHITSTGEVIGSQNTVYATSLGPALPDLRGFSKTFGDAYNPSQGFAAVMVCSEADASCPYVPGAELRVSLPYLDPKASDGSPDETATYLAKSEEIGREMLWLMQQVAP
ncbi:MAG: protein-tyrosine-phosphatase [Myxococcota bacterium]|nr:protein-tyrosine-phosphatase [Myxococcota bacterium]